MPKQTDIEAFLASYPARSPTSLMRRGCCWQQRYRGPRKPSINRPGDQLQYSPGSKGTVCALILSKTGVKIGLFRGSELPDPKGLLRGSGKVHRHVAPRDAS